MQRKSTTVRSTFGDLIAFEDDLITQQIQDFGAHTRPELAMLLGMVDPGDSVFDLGAHIGTFSIPIAQKVGTTGRVLAVEAEPEHFLLLSENVRRLCLGLPLDICQQLIAPVASYSAVSTEGNTGATHFVNAGETSNTPTVTIDDLARNYFVPRVMKIDIEGYELHALLGASKALSFKPIIYAEVAEQLLERCGSSIVALDELLRSYRYRFFVNVGERNAAHDRYQIAELPSLTAGGAFFDVLAIHVADERLNRVLNSSTHAARNRS